MVCSTPSLSRYHETAVFSLHFSPLAFPGKSGGLMSPTRLNLSPDPCEYHRLSSPPSPLFRFTSSSAWRRVLVLGNAQLAQMVGARGPNMQTNAACAGSTLGVAMAQVRRCGSPFFASLIIVEAAKQLRILVFWLLFAISLVWVFVFPICCAGIAVGCRMWGSGGGWVILCMCCPYHHFNGQTNHCRFEPSYLLLLSPECPKEREKLTAGREILFAEGCAYPT